MGNRIHVHFLMLCWYLDPRALLHFLDPEKFRSKDEFTEKYKNLSSFDEKEVCSSISDHFCGLWIFEIEGPVLSLCVVLKWTVHVS
jgi:hypothetical protein